MEKQRNRVVMFRVTQQELEQVKVASALRGSRCLSEFVRSTVLRTTGSSQSPVEPNSVDERLLAIDRRLSAMETNMVRLLDAADGARLAAKAFGDRAVG